jgi:hypothetical protein
LAKVYWLPWYTNNQQVNTQLRIANVSTSTATIRISIGGQLMPGNPFTLAAGEAVTKSYAGIDKGPVKIVSNVKIVASARVIYKSAGGLPTSFSETIGLPASQLDSIYWLPWYTYNKQVNTQLRLLNVTNAEAHVHVIIGNVEMTDSPFTIPVGGNVRKNFPGVNKGPVQIVSDQNIVASARVIYTVNGKVTSFSETMGLPASQLDSIYWLPWYTNNPQVNTQLRLANVSDTVAHVHVIIGNVEMTGSPFTIPVGGNVRKNFAGIDKGPVKIASDQDVVASARVIYLVNGVATSFTETMALPDSLKHTIFWFPWYTNNPSMNTQLRVTVP